MGSIMLYHRLSLKSCLASKKKGYELVPGHAIEVKFSQKGCKRTFFMSSLYSGSLIHKIFSAKIRFRGPWPKQQFCLEG